MSAASPQPAASALQARLVALMVALSATSYFNRTIMSIAGPGIMQEFGISETRMGAIYSAFLLSYSLLMTPGGGLADRFGPRLVLAVTGLGTALFTGLTALGGQPGLGELLGVVPSFVAIRFLFGACTAPLYPACGRMTANWIPAADTGRVQGFIMAAAALGSAISPVLFAAMIARFGWRFSFWLAAAFTTALFLLWLASVRDHPVGAARAAVIRKPAGLPWARLLQDRNLLLLTLSYFCLNYFEYIFFYWIYYYFGEIRRLGKSQSAVYVTILMLAMVVMTPLGGWISDRLVARYGRKAGRRALPLAGLSLSAVLLFAGARDLGTFATVALLSLAFGCAASAEGPFWASAIDAGGQNVGAACGLLNTGGNIGGLLAPVFTPWIASRLGWTWGLHAGSLAVMAGVVAWFFIDPTAPAREASEP